MNARSLPPAVTPPDAIDGGAIGGVAWHSDALRRGVASI